MPIIWRPWFYDSISPLKSNAWIIQITDGTGQSLGNLRLANAHPKTCGETERMVVTPSRSVNNSSAL